MNRSTIIKRTVFCFWLFFMLIISPAVLHALPENKILASRYFSTPQQETIEVKTSASPAYKTFTLKNPRRFVVDFDNTFLPGVHLDKKTSGENILQYRISQNTPEKSRLVVRLKPEDNPEIKIRPTASGTYILAVTSKRAITPAVSPQPPGAMKQMFKPILETDFEPEISAPALEREPIGADSGIDSSAPDNASDVILADTRSDDEIILSMDTQSIDEDIFSNDVPEPEEKTWKISGTIQNRLTADTKDNQTNENVASAKNRTLLKVDYKNSFTVSGLSDYLYFGSHDETDEYDIDLHELSFRKNFGAVGFSFGKQIKRWGKTDQISPLDTLNPENLTEFYIPDYEERKIPVWMAELSYRKSHFFIESILIPFFEPSNVDFFGTDWAVFSHAKSDINDSTVFNSAMKNYFNSMRVNEDEPSRDLDAVEYAFRIGGTISDFDWGLTYHKTTEDAPHFKSFPVKNLSIKSAADIGSIAQNMGSLTFTNENIEVEYLETQVFGVEFETVLKSIGLRGEAAFTENTSFMTQDFTSTRQPTLFYVLGADYSGTNGFYTNLQFGHQHIHHYDPAILYYEKDNYMLISQIKRDIWQNWLTADLQCTYILNDESFHISPRLVYSYVDNLEITLGMNLFGGSASSLFGQYDDYDQVMLDIIYQF